VVPSPPDSSWKEMMGEQERKGGRGGGKNGRGVGADGDRGEKKAGEG